MRALVLLVLLLVSGCPGSAVTGDDTGDAGTLPGDTGPDRADVGPDAGSTDVPDTGPADGGCSLGERVVCDRCNGSALYQVCQPDGSWGECPVCVTADAGPEVDAPEPECVSGTREMCVVPCRGSRVCDPEGFWGECVCAGIPDAGPPPDAWMCRFGGEACSRDSDCCAGTVCGASGLCEGCGGARGARCCPPGTPGIPSPDGCTDGLSCNGAGMCDCGGTGEACCLLGLPCEGVGEMCYSGVCRAHG